MPEAAGALPIGPLPLRGAAALLRLAPLAALQIAFDVALPQVLRRAALPFDRLGPHAAKRFGIQPLDLPVAFVLVPGPAPPRVLVLRRLPARLDVRISGSIVDLIRIIEGEADADALFFGRSIEVEGDIDAALALRNTIDAGDATLLRAFAACHGPLAGPVERLLRRVLAPPATGNGIAGAARPWN